MLHYEEYGLNLEPIKTARDLVPYRMLIFFFNFIDGGGSLHDIMFLRNSGLRDLQLTSYNAGLFWALPGHILQFIFS